MFYLFKILNKIILKGIMLLFLYLVTAYYLGRGVLTALMALAAFCVVSIIMNLIKDKKSRFRDRSIEYEKKVDYYVKQLLLKTRTAVSKFFGGIFSQAYDTVTRSEFLILKEKGSSSPSFLVLPVFTTPKINEDSVRRAFILAKRHNINKAVILCNSYDKDAETALSGIKSINIRLLDKYSVFGIMEQYGDYPSVEEENAANLEKKKFKLNFILNKYTASGFFYTALYLSLFSFIVPMKLYYLIAAGINLLLGLTAETVSAPKAPENVI